MLSAMQCATSTTHLSAYKVPFAKGCWQLGYHCVKNKLGYVQNDCPAVWQRNHKAGHLAGVEQVWLELRHCHCLRNEMAHFCTDLQTYIMFEVLETAWDIFMRQLQVTSTL